ncbi:MAG: hypothetical protein HOQ05_04395 [Corynebacteriales bacterium]|nr:hypothetical protein [Mycobacteriales bacterium]
MTTSETPTGRAAVFTGSSPTSARWVAALILLSAAGLFIGIIATDTHWWVKVVVGFLVTPLLVVLAFSLWGDAKEQQTDFARLRHAGRPAVAHIVEMTVDTDGETEWAELTLEISGPDVPPFQGYFRCPPEPVMKVGARLKAVVDPTDNLFTLRSL